MARLHHQHQHHGHRRRCAVAPTSISALLLAIVAAATVSDLLFSSTTAPPGSAAAAAAGDEGEIRISVTYPTEEEERWLDSWVDKYRAPPGAAGSDGDGDDFSVHPATDEESAYINRIYDDHGAGGVRREGYEGTIEFVNDRPRLIVDKVHSGASSPPPSKPPKDDDDDGLLLHNIMDEEL